MGLGLAIVKGIIEAHKGDIIETGTPGAGARFEVYLPLRAEEAD
jgi:signal transduction histidine kinase